MVRMRKRDLKEFEDCVFCRATLARRTRSREHVFPKLIGGWFWVDFVCRQCNSSFGNSFDADLRKNPYVHFARRRLGFGRGSAYLKGQKITAETPQGHKGRMAPRKSDGVPRWIPSPQPGGSIISDPESAKTQMVDALRREGRSEEFIKKNYLDLVDTAPDGKFVPVRGTRHGFIYHRDVLTTISYDELNLPFRYALIAKIAIELYFASGIWREFPVDLGAQIEAIMSNDPRPLAMTRGDFARLGSPDQLEYQPLHFAEFAVLNGHLVAVVGLFGMFSFGICLGKVGEILVGNCRTYHWVFPIGQERVLYRDIPPESVMEAHYNLMVVALGDWFKKHPGEIPKSVTK